MPSSVTTHQFCVWEDSSLVVMARVLGGLGANITQAYLSSVTCRVYTSSGTLVASPAVTIASSVYDALQETEDDPRWTLDTTGYNFSFTVPASAFPSPGMYRVEFKFTPASGDAFYVVCRINVLNLFQS